MSNEIIPNILYVDDESINLRLFKISFSEGYKTTLASSGEEALEMITEGGKRFDVIISDQRMGGMSGTEFMIEAKKIMPNTKYILLTGYTDIEALENAINQVGLWQFVKKPWEPSNLKFIINNAFSSLKTERENTIISSALTKSEERLNLALEGTEAGVWDWDLKTNEMYFSPTWKKMLGFENEELDNNLKTWERLLHQDDLQYAFSHLDDYIKGKISNYEVEFRLQHKDGHYVHILSRARGVKSENGDFKRLTGTNIDLTEKIRSQDQIKQLNEELEERVERRTHALKLLNIQLIQRNKFEHLISKISSELLAAKSTDLTARINSSIKDIINFTNADLSFVLRLRDGLFLLESEQTSKGIDQSVFKLFHEKKISDFPLLHGELSKNNSIAIKDVQKINDPFTIEKEVFKAFNLKSILIIPLTFNGVLKGCFGMSFLNINKEWNHEDNNLLRFVGEIFTNALERYDSEQLLLRRDLKLSEANKIISENEKKTKLVKSVASIANSPIPLNEALTLSLDIIHEEGEGFNAFILKTDNNRQEITYSLNGETQQNLLQVPSIKTAIENTLKAKAPIIVKNIEIQEQRNAFADIVTIPIIVLNDIKYVFVLILKPKNILLNDALILKEIAREISFVVERDLTQTELQRSIEKEKELVDLKSQFISMASHQFRTPLTVIQSNIELFQMLAAKSNSDLKDKFETISNRIQEEVSRLGDLMNDVLLLGQINASALQVNLEELDVVELINKTVHKLNSIQKDNRVARIEIKGPQKLVKIDEKLFSHTINNLLENAFKYSAEKSAPLVSIDFNSNLIIEVTDFGRGVPEGEITKLFQPFYRGNNVQDIQGTGLGLVICRRYTELQGGQLDVRSDEHIKTTFTIKLPL